MKILDFETFKCEQQMKHPMIEIKDIKFRPTVDANDYQVKLRTMKSYIDQGNKVKVTLRFRDREIALHEIGSRLLERIKNGMDPVTKVEQMPRMGNRQMVMVLSPR